MLLSVSTMPVGDDIENLKKYVKQIENFADFLHCDICDGEYNQTKCFSGQLVNEINKITTMPLDCHLMTKNARELAKVYIESGANIVTAQIESFACQDQIFEYIEFAKSKKALVGLAIEPKTEIKRILPYLDKLDVVLVMSVKTGASGQIFDQSVLSKIEYLSTLKKHQNMNFLIEVDGGINDQTARQVKDAGADIIVSGNYVYNSKNIENAICLLKK